MSERNRAVPASYLMLRKGNKILLARRINTGYYDGYYHPPAGHIEAGELPIDALIREVKEEIGIDLVRDSVTLVHTMYRTKHDPTGDRADYFFQTSEYDGEIENLEPEKCDDIQWFSIDELPKNTVPHVRDAIADIENEVAYSELGLDKVVKSP